MVVAGGQAVFQQAARPQLGQPNCLEQYVLFIECLMIVGLIEFLSRVERHPAPDEAMLQQIRCAGPVFGIVGKAKSYQALELVRVT